MRDVQAKSPTISHSPMVMRRLVFYDEVVAASEQAKAPFPILVSILRQK